MVAQDVGDRVVRLAVAGRELGRVERVALPPRRTRPCSGRSGPGRRARAEPARRRARLRGAGDVAALGQPRPSAAAIARRAEAGSAVEPAGERVGHVARVAAEGLVAAVAVQRDGDVSAGQLGEVEARDRRRVGERLAVVADDLRQRCSIASGPDLELLVDGAVLLGDAASVRQLVELLVVEADREGAHGLARLAAPSRRRPPTSRSRPTGRRRAARRRSCACGWPRAGRCGSARTAPRPTRPRASGSSRAASSADLGAAVVGPPACGRRAACARRAARSAAPGTYPWAR